MMGHEGGDLLLAGAACAGGRAATRSLWMQAVSGGLSGLAPKFQWREHVKGNYTWRAIQIDTDTDTDTDTFTFTFTFTFTKLLQLHYVQLFTLN